MTEAVKLNKGNKAEFKEKLMNKLPNGVNLNMCLTCGACASGCRQPGSGIWIRANLSEWWLWAWTKNWPSTHGYGCAPSASGVCMSAP